MGNYVPNTAQQQKAMLEAIGMASYDELFSVIPDSVKLDHLDLPEGLSELEVQHLITVLAAKNTVYPTIFRGAGAYRHYIPAIVKNVISKEEFITAYTPYQAEISQGILQSIFEYQTMICELTGMDVSNASVYDGASAAAEAVGMCCERKRQKVVVSAAIHPQTLAAVETYCWGKDREVVVIPERDGITDLAALSNLLDEACACVLIQQPNYYGHLEPCEEISALAHQAGVVEVDVKKQDITIQMYQKADLDVSGIPALMEKYKGTLTFRTGDVPSFYYRDVRQKHTDCETMLVKAREILSGLAALAKE